MPKPFPAEFRRDVIAVARRGEASMTQVARDFGFEGGEVGEFVAEDVLGGVQWPAAGVFDDEVVDADVEV